MEVMGSRNLAFTAGTAKAYGLSSEQALQLITLNPAKIAGIDNLTGSLEVGKMADFFITKGDALDMRTAYVLNIYIQGKEVDSDNHQKELYRKYMERYGKPLKE
jgi:imidazolonepropionase-like amidohydrolase